MKIHNDFRNRNTQCFGNDGGQSLIRVGVTGRIVPKVKLHAGGLPQRVKHRVIFREVILKFLEERPEGAGVQEIHGRFKEIMPKQTPSNNKLGTHLSYLFKKGLITKNLTRMNGKRRTIWIRVAP